MKTFMFPVFVPSIIRSACQVALAVAIAGVIVASAARAETLTYNLGPVGSGTTIVGFEGNQLNNLEWKPKGFFPVGTYLTSVSVNARLDAASNGDNWASDLSFFLDPQTGGAPRLQVGGYNTVDNTITKVNWSNGDDSTIGATVIDTKSAPGDFASTIDLHDYQVSLINGWSGPVTWSGTISFDYVIPVPEPGTGSLVVIAGLGAVAVTLFRRRRGR